MYAIYARQSIDKKDSISIESQVEFCKYEVRNNDYKEYIDKGFSGKDINRPQFLNLLKDIKNGNIEKVVVYKLDRISRSILDFANMIEIFQKYSVEFISSTEKFDTSSPIGRAMLNICIVFAQLERETIQKRIMDSYHSRSIRGFYMGGKIPYGFCKEDTIIEGVKTSKYLQVYEEAKHIQLIYSLYSKSKYTLGDIVKYFNDHGIKHLRDKKWNTARLSEMIRNPIYVKADIEVYNFYKEQGTKIINSPSDFIGHNGCYLYSANGTSNKSQYDLKNKILVLAPHEGIVSSEEWIECRKRCVKGREVYTTRKGKNSWIIGKIKCLDCGYALVLRRSGGKCNKKGHFICSNKIMQKKCIGAVTIGKGELEDFIFNIIKTKLLLINILSGVKFNGTSLKVREYKIKISNIQVRISSLLSKVENSNSILMKYINKEIKRLDREKIKLEKKILSLCSEYDTSRKIFIYKYLEKWEIISFEDKSLILDTLIKVVKINNNQIDIVWNI